MIYSCLVLILLTASHFVAVAPRGVRGGVDTDHRNLASTSSEGLLARKDSAALHPVPASNDESNHASSPSQSHSSRSKGIRRWFQKARRHLASKRGRDSKKGKAASKSDTPDGEASPSVVRKVGAQLDVPVKGKGGRGGRSGGNAPAAGTSNAAAPAAAVGTASTKVAEGGEGAKAEDNARAAAGVQGQDSGRTRVRRDPNSAPRAGRGRRNRNRGHPEDNDSTGPPTTTTITTTSQGAGTGAGNEGEGNVERNDLPQRGPKPRRFRTQQDAIDDLKPRNHNATQLYHSMYTRVNGTRIHKVNGTVLPDRSKYTRNRSVPPMSELPSDAPMNTKDRARAKADTMKKRFGWNLGDSATSSRAPWSDNGAKGNNEGIEDERDRVSTKGRGAAGRGDKTEASTGDHDAVENSRGSELTSRGRGGSKKKQGKKGGRKGKNKDDEER